MPLVVLPFLAGVIVSPLAQKIVKPIARGAVKGSVGLTVNVKQACARVRAEVQGAAAAAVAKHAVESPVSGGTAEAGPSATPRGATER
ncbi:DUF5132 domain-containing protein [Streptomyces sp. NPDC059443]|uniref:DUF5132 domain-containing protein n=1 Tax=unclassified Streptomyces TaxID=2593676 RepID=UPI003697891D